MDSHKVIQEIAAERQRQIEREGWTAEHDDEHVGGVMAEAAASYAMTHRSKECPLIWPWEQRWWKPRDRRRDLVRAAALIVAEIERLDRATPTDSAALAISHQSKHRSQP
jgi:hypothetical protein